MKKTLALIFLALFFLFGNFHVGLFARQWQEFDYWFTDLRNYKTNKILRQSIDFQNVDYKALSASLYYETNARRKKHGLPILARHPLLEKIAFQHSKTMVKKNFFSHTNPFTGSTAYNRFKKAGIANPVTAENIATHFGLRYKSGTSVYIPAKGQFSYTHNGPLIPPHTYLSIAKSILDQWMHSSGHRRNILSTKARQVGCGAYLYINTSFNDMPMFKVTQNFQLYKNIILKKDPATPSHSFRKQG